VIAGLRARVGATRVVRASGRYLETPYASTQLMLAAGGGLLFFGLLMSASTTISASVHTTGDAMWSQLIRQVAFLVISVPVFWLAVRMPPAAYRRLAYPSLMVAVIGLIGVLIPRVGATINGARLWIRLGPITLQPSEIAKILLMVFFASFLVSKRDVLSLASRRVMGIDS